MNTAQSLERIKGPGFIAALDQSGGSTPKALKAYGLDENAWNTEEEMFRLVHEMRTRIITNRAFDHRVSGAILFQRTAEDSIDGVPTAKYLSSVKKIVPFLKIDDGLLPKEHGIQLMKPIYNLDALLRRAVELGIFGTKMRSVIHQPTNAGVQAVVEQQFDTASKIIDAGLMPIIEPEVDIHSPDKAKAELLLKEYLLKHLDAVPHDQKVMLKLTLPEESNFYRDLIEHPHVLRLVALSGGYTRDEANRRLALNSGMTASFSRALVEDLRAQQTDEEFTAALNATIQSIYDASLT